VTYEAPPRVENRLIDIQADIAACLQVSDQVNSLAQRATAVVHDDIAGSKTEPDEPSKDRIAMLFPDWVRSKRRVSAAFANKMTLYRVDVELLEIAPWALPQPAPVRSEIRSSIAICTPPFAYPAEDPSRQVEDVNASVHGRGLQDRSSGRTWRRGGTSKEATFDYVRAR
jgi:hypothetical protein